MPDTQTIAQRVASEVRREMAAQQKRSQPLADLLGVSNAAVSRRLRGHVPLDVNELDVVARYLGKKPADFIPADEVALAVT